MSVRKFKGPLTLKFLIQILTIPNIHRLMILMGVKE